CDHNSDSRFERHVDDPNGRELQHSSGGAVEHARSVRSDQVSITVRADDMVAPRYLDVAYDKAVLGGASQPAQSLARLCIQKITIWREKYLIPPSRCCIRKLSHLSFLETP